MGGLDFTELFKNFGSLKARAEEMQQKLSRLQITGEAGAGMVKVTVSGDGTVVDVKVESELLTSKEMLEELMIAATNEALRKAREAMAHEMQGLTGGLPGMDKMFGA